LKSLKPKTMKIELIKVVPRVCKETKEIELFYYEQHRIKGLKDLVCFCHSMGHCLASYMYYCKCTIKVPENRRDEANLIVKNYIGNKPIYSNNHKNHHNHASIF